jgi:hypothetical protein
VKDFSLEERILKYHTVERNECRDCGNKWWFSMEDCYVCTTCAKTHGRSTSDEYVPKVPGTNSDKKSSAEFMCFLWSQRSEA